MNRQFASPYNLPATVVSMGLRLNGARRSEALNDTALTAVLVQFHLYRVPNKNTNAV